MLFAVDATDRSIRPHKDPRHMSKNLQRSDNLDLSQNLLSLCHQFDGHGQWVFEWRDCWYCLGLHHIVLSRLRWWFGFIRWLFCVTWQGSLDFVVDCDLWEYRLIVSNHVIRHRAALKSLSILVEVCHEVCSFGVFLVDNQVSGSSMMGTIGFKISLHTLIRF